MLKRGIFIVVLVAICASRSNGSDGDVVRRAGQHRRAALFKRRDVAVDASPRMTIRKVRRDDSNAYPEAHLGNIGAMKKYVEELKQMNTDWQEASMQALKEGKTPSEFPSTDSIANASPAPKSKNQNDQHNHYNAPKPKEQTHNKPHPHKQQQPSPPPPPPPQPKKQTQQHKQQQAPAPPAKQKTAHPKEAVKAAVSAPGGTLNLPAGVLQAYPHGSMTYYLTGMGACGWTNKDSDYIVALSSNLWNKFGSMSNGNPACGRRIHITRDGKDAYAQIADECPGCDDGHIDMSPGLFKHFESLDVGECEVSWEFV